MSEEFTSSTCSPQEAAVVEPVADQQAEGEPGPEPEVQASAQTDAVFQSVPDTMLDAALFYRAHGFSVIPVRGNDKKPHVNWKVFQTRLPTEAEVREWWAKWPDANIAIVTGSVSGIVAVDIDGEAGRKKLDDLLRVHGPISGTIKATSGRTDGGEHIFFKHPDKHVPTFADNGLDSRGDGGYVIVAPSIHASGRKYQWASEQGVTLAALPVWLLEYFSGLKKDSRKDGNPAPLEGLGDLPLHLQGMCETDPGFNAGFQIPAATIPYTPDNMAHLRSALNLIDANCPRGVWLSLLCAIKNLHFDHGWPEGVVEGAAHEWSRRGTEAGEYSEEAFHETWHSITLRVPGQPKANVGTIIYHARQKGWTESFDRTEQGGNPEGSEELFYAPDKRYRMTKTGLYFINKEDDKAPPIFLSNPFEILAETRDAQNNSWGVWLRWADHDGKLHEWVMPRALLAGEGADLFAEFLDRGLHVASGRKARQLLKDYLAGSRLKARARCVTRVGWHEQVYVMPDRTFGPVGEEKTILQTTGKAPRFEVKGTLQGWQESIGKLAIGNSRLALSVSAAFAGPLLHLLREENGGVHFVGPSSIGKSKTVRAAASVWGSEDKNWRTTDNSAENLACEASDGLLVLDEIGQADPRVIDAMTYMLGNGKGKSRMRKDGTSREAAAWRILFLSTGEVGIEDKLREGGKKSRAGQSVRMIEIPADAGAGHGLFENLHGLENGGAFADAIDKAAKEHRGHAIASYLERLVENPGLYAKQAEAVRNNWLSVHNPAGADGQVVRVAGRFALIAAAGELATRMGILPWPEEEAARAAATCFKAWLNRRGGTEAAEITGGMAQVRAFLEQHGSSRFESMEGAAQSFPDPRVINRAGFRRKSKVRGTDEWEYLILPEVWKNEVCKGYDAAVIAKEMVARKLMLPDTANKTSRSEDLPGLGKKRVYVITAAIFGDDNDAKQT